MGVLDKDNNKARELKERIRGWQDQLKQWRLENCIGHDLWTMENKEQGFTLTATQTKFGVMIIQEIPKNAAFVIFEHKMSY